MTHDELVRSAKQRLEDQTVRLRTVLANMPDEKWNRPGNPLSVGQIIEHLVIVNRAYVQELEGLVRQAPENGGELPARYSIAGKLLINAAGPDSNAPMPGSVTPRTGEIPRGIETEFFALNEKIVTACDLALGKNLSVVKFKNPIVGIIVMRLPDMFEVLAQHGERHTRQIEALATS